MPSVLVVILPLPASSLRALLLASPSQAPVIDRGSEGQARPGSRRPPMHREALDRAKRRDPAARGTPRSGSARRSKQPESLRVVDAVSPAHCQLVRCGLQPPFGGSIHGGRVAPGVPSSAVYFPAAARPAVGGRAAELHSRALRGPVVPDPHREPRSASEDGSGCTFSALAGLPLGYKATVATTTTTTPAAERQVPRPTRHRHDSEPREGTYSREALPRGPRSPCRLTARRARDRAEHDPERSGREARA